MQKTVARLVAALLSLAGILRGAAAQTGYAPIPVTHYKQDVPANGTGPAMAIGYTDTLALTGRTLADWFKGANPVGLGVGRVNYDPNALPGSAAPRWSEVPLHLLTTNYARTIKNSALDFCNKLAVSMGAGCPNPPRGGTAAASATRLCPGMSTSLSVSGAAAGASTSYQWQAAAEGSPTWADAACATATTYTATPTITTQYRLRAAGSGTTSFSTPVTVVVEPPDVATLTYRNPSFCQTAGATAAPAVSPAGGTFAGTPGLVINPSTGLVNLASSTAGVHTVTYTSAGFCPATATAGFTLVGGPAATLAYGGGVYCQAAASPVPTVAPAGGTFAGTPGLAVSATTGLVSLAQSTPGLHTVTYTLAGACATPVSASFRIEATARPEFYNVITPNGDGKNEYLTVSLPSVSDYEMQVYSRWGKRVWQSTDPGARWAAEGSPAGLYYYWVRFADCSGQAQTHRSWVEVIK